MPSLRHCVAEEHVGAQEQYRGCCFLGSRHAFGVKYARVRMVEEVDAVLFKVHFHPVVCCRPGKQTVMIIVGRYGDDFPSRLLRAYGLPTEFTQVVYDVHHLERATFHLRKGRLSDVDPHWRFGL